jgi:hypothetical protein
MIHFACYGSHGQGGRPGSADIVGEGMTRMEDRRSHYDGGDT